MLCVLEIELRLQQIELLLHHVNLRLNRFQVFLLIERGLEHFEIELGRR